MLKLKTLVSKSEIRNNVIKKRNEFNDEELIQKTKLIVNRFTSTDSYLSAKTIHTYISTRKGEVDTKKLIDKMYSDGKSIVLPKLNKVSNKFQRAYFTGWDKLIKNRDGYYEPELGFDEDLTDIDIMIVPTVAVSLSGQRVGYGGDFYDKILKNFFALKVALAFEFQVFDNIEADEHDVKVGLIVTERRIINPIKPMDRNSELL